VLGRCVDKISLATWGDLFCDRATRRCFEESANDAGPTAFLPAVNESAGANPPLERETARIDATFG
jgi:hypothetical protein